MNILYVIGDSLENNSSTISFKKIILNELLKKNHQVTLIQYSHDSAKSFEKTNKKGMDIIIGSPKFYFIDRLMLKIESKFNKNMKFNKSVWNEIYPEGFIKKITFNIDGVYDVVLSISSPVYTHRIAYDLISKSNIKYGRWNQIWFEPWLDSVNNSSKSNGLILDEDNLLKKADKIFYSSDLILEDHAKLYPKHQNKMNLFDMPAYPKEIARGNDNEFSVGYFGAYYSEVRNIVPLYQTLERSKYKSIIIGNSDIELKETDEMKIITERLSEEECLMYEKESSVLVVLSNWFADLIPGKLYKYAAWDKPILVILDGSDRLKDYLIKRFGSYEKFYFSENNQKDIEFELNKIRREYQFKNYEPIQDFNPKYVVEKLLE